MWDKAVVDLLIIKYQEHENLYDVNNPMYLDRVKRSKSLLEICKKLKELKNDITVEEIKKKIHTLRTQYIKESRERERNGVNAVDVQEPRLWCFHKLEFLKPHCARRKSILTKPSTEKGDESKMEEASVETNSESPTHPRGSKRKKPLKIDERIDNIKSLLKKRFEEKTDYDWLGKQVVFEMNLIKNKRIRRDTAWKIQTILREASIEDGSISESQSIQISSEFLSDTKSSCDSYSSEEQPKFSSFSSEACQQSDSIDRNASSSNISICPVRLIAANSFDSSPSYLISPADIKQQPLEDI